MSPADVHAAVPNGIPVPDLDLPYPDRPEVITANLLKITELAPDPRVRFIFKNLISKLHEFVHETNLTTDEWMSTIKFLTRTGQTCTPLRQEFILLSDVLGVSALVDALNNPSNGIATESSVLGPFFTEDAPDVPLGESIASEGKGEYMYVEGRVVTSSGDPIPDAVIETWETDEKGFYDTQYTDRSVPDCRGRLRTDAEGKYGFRAVVPVPYPIPGDGPVGDLLLTMGRHNVRPNHLHMMIKAGGFRKLTTSLYPEGDIFLSSDVVFGVKKSLVVKLTEVDDEVEARKRGFQKGTKFKLLNYDFTLLTHDEAGVRGLDD
ncbi:aromatic compound dioxygenase [Russula ochroleuca]|jgi:protocatechuate 3,4-dioxygenase beta subunit|uniref:Aromatic compound dioxygenase n=1 Tax=Russula ochroleuca TaxID=152965 RepID=A0A9P5JUU5_9AGAM|nr:aromatic compound dioxygenase [Russula ochroleuca]KAF8483867.1 aromatic compound dioxygenase [Russula ochroleuca]